VQCFLWDMCELHSCMHSIVSIDSRTCARCTSALSRDCVCVRGGVDSALYCFAEKCLRFLYMCELHACMHAFDCEHLWQHMCTVH